MESNKALKVALVHDYLVQYGGAEKVLESLCELFPEAPIYTSFYSPENMTPTINSHKIHSISNSIIKKVIKGLSFIMPMVFENFDLREYDLIISDSSSWSKGVITSPEQIHIAYIHNPPRFLYGYSGETTLRENKFLKPLFAIPELYLRNWDYAAAQRPDYLVANSQEIQRRIQKFYRRESTLIYPPVNVSFDTTKIPSEAESIKNLDINDFYICLGRQVKYKNFETIIKGFSNNNKQLVVVGTGPEESHLRDIATSNVIFTGKASEELKFYLLSKAKGCINAVVDEDLGIVPIEAMSQGTPVLAHRSGGHLETVIEDVTGMLYNSNQNFDTALTDFIRAVENGAYDRTKIRESVQKFDVAIFKQSIKEFVETKIKDKDARIT